MIATYLRGNKKTVKMLFCWNSDQWPNNTTQDRFACSKHSSILGIKVINTY